MFRPLFSAAVTTLILVFLIRALRRNWREAGVYRVDIAWGWVLVSVLFLGLYFFLAARIWRRILRFLGEEISLASACRIWFLSQLGKYVPGKVWFAVGRIYLCRQAGVGALPASIGTVLEILLVILAAAFVFLLSSPLWPGIDRFALIAVPAAILFLLVVVHPKVFGALLGRALRLARREPTPLLFSWRDLCAVAGWYGVTWLVYGAGMELLLRAVRVEGGGVMTPALPAAARILFFAGAAGVAWAIGFVSIVTPSGLGVREATLGYLLAIHLPQPLPVLLALVTRIWITAGEAGAALVGSRLGRKKG